ncbi:MAG: hypothetical protein ABJC04_12915 [Verrucomicrobiota bacterium]
MKKFAIILVILCGVAACAIFYLNRQKSPPPASAPIAESFTGETTQQAPSEKIRVSIPEPVPVISESANQPAQVPAPAPAVGETETEDSTNSIHKAVDALLSAKSAKEKHELFQQLLKTGQLDNAIAELKQRMVGDPKDAGIPTTMGEAQLNKLRAIHEAGGDLNEVGILAMQADQSFNSALKIDPQNYEAQVVKAIAMHYWPADPVRDNDVVQRLSSVIDQQETMTSRSEFAQPYAVLGEQYKKMGQPDKALATWQIGLSKFPNDPVLQKKLSNSSNP